MHNKRKKENDSEIETINVKKATKKSSKLCNSCEHDYYDDDEEQKKNWIVVRLVKNGSVVIVLMK